MSQSAISQAPFGKTPDGLPVEIYTLRNKNGLEARIMTYGGILVSLKTPDKSGKFEDIVFGYDNLEGYLKRNPYFGALVGRYGNRIAKGKFSLNGKNYSLATNNNNVNHLHGGIKGFDKVVWTAKPLEIADGPTLQLNYLSKDGEEGFPGNLSVTATYTLTNDNALKLDFTATTDKDTVCNLTHHSYFNFHGNGDVLAIISSRSMRIEFTPIDATMRSLPASCDPVAGTTRLISENPLPLRRTLIATMNRFNSPKVSITTGSSTNRLGGSLRSHTFGTRPADAAWKSLPPNRECNFTQEIFWMAALTGKEADGPITGVTPFAWSPNTFPILRTILISHPSN